MKEHAVACLTFPILCWSETDIVCLLIVELEEWQVRLGTLSYVKLTTIGFRACGLGGWVSVMPWAST